MLRRQWIKNEKNAPTITRQLELAMLTKTFYYYKPIPESPNNLLIMDLIDKIYTEYPFYGSRKMVEGLARMGHIVNRKRVLRLMQKMGLCPIYPKPNLSKKNNLHKIYPYLLRNIEIIKPNQVWSTDITYIPVRSGYFYLIAIIDWFSRYVLSWKLSNTMDIDFCIEVLDEALKIAIPEIFNSDQGSQFTSYDFINILEKENVSISMDGKERCIDNIFVERLWRTIKYEEVFIKKYENGLDAKINLDRYIQFYNEKQYHQSLKYKTPQEVYFNFGGK
jgi:putative transposase